MADVAVAGMVVGVVGIVCFALAAVIIGILALCRGHCFSGRASKESIEVTTGPASKTEPDER